jgi:hypothetical protein
MAEDAVCNWHHSIRHVNVFRYTSHCNKVTGANVTSKVIKILAILIMTHVFPLPRARVQTLQEVKNVSGRCHCKHNSMKFRFSEAHFEADTTFIWPQCKRNQLLGLRTYRMPFYGNHEIFMDMTSQFILVTDQSLPYSRRWPHYVNTLLRINFHNKNVEVGTQFRNAMVQHQRLHTRFEGRNSRAKKLLTVLLEILDCL